MKKFLYSSLTDTSKDVFLFHEVIDYSEEKHIHDFYEIIYVESGEIEEIINDHAFNVKRGDLLFVDLGSTHTFSPKTKFSFYNICLKPTNLDLNSESKFAPEIIHAFNENKHLFINKVLSFSGNERRILEEMLESMIIEQNANGLLCDEIINGFMSVIISKIINKILTPETDSNGWDELDKYISENLDADLSLHSLASKSFYNPSYFCRVFKQKHGESLVSYVNKKKIEKAKQLLTSTDLSIDEITQQLGYSNVSVFYRNFTKITGYTPIAFKEDNK